MSVRNESGRVAGKVAFITGAGQGQGRAHALALAAEGARIVGCDLDTPYPDCVNYAPANAELLAETRQLVEEAGGEMVTAVADVRRLDELRAAVAVGLEAFGRIDVVCANAGLATFPSSPFDVSEEEYDVVMDTNAKGCWNTVLATAPHMIGARRPGSIIMTSSAAGLRGHVPYAHYVAAKHAVVGLMRSFSNELARHGIRVNTVHPTGVASPGMGSDPNIFPLFESRPDFPPVRHQHDAGPGLQLRRQPRHRGLPVGAGPRPGGDLPRGRLPGLRRVPLHHRPDPRRGRGVHHQGVSRRRAAGAHPAVAARQVV